MHSRIFVGRGRYHEKMHFCSLFNSLPHGKILDPSELRAFADDKINVTKKLKFVLGRV